MRNWMRAAALIAALCYGGSAYAGGVPNPVNAPASMGSGDVYSASGTNPQQAADSGIAASNVVTLAGSQTLTNKTLTSPALTTPNIGAATGTSLTFSGNGPLAFNTHSSICDNGSSILEIGASAACGTGGTIDANLGYFSILSNRNSTHIWESTTAPTVTSGLGTATVAGNGTWVLKITITAGTPTATTVLAFPAASTGWVCDIPTDRTSAITGKQTADTTTSVTFTWSAPPAVGDVISDLCAAY